MEFWIARNKIGNLHMSVDKPQLVCDNYVLGSKDCLLDKDLFPEITFENSPRKIRIELVYDGL